MYSRGFTSCLWGPEGGYDCVMREAEAEYYTCYDKSLKTQDCGNGDKDPRCQGGWYYGTWNCWISNYPPPCAMWDFNDDSNIDMRDYQLFQQNPDKTRLPYWMEQFVVNKMNSN